VYVIASGASKKRRTGSAKKERVCGQRLVNRPWSTTSDARIEMKGEGKKSETQERHDFNRTDSLFPAPSKGDGEGRAHQSKGREK